MKTATFKFYAMTSEGLKYTIITRPLLMVLSSGGILVEMEGKPQINIDGGYDLLDNYWYAIYTEYEAPNYELDLEVQWTNVDFDENNEELAIYIDKGNTYSLEATGGYMLVGDGTPDWGSTTGTISFWVKMEGSVQGRFWGQNGNMETRWSGTNLVLDWGGTGSMTSAHSFSAHTWYFVAIVWNETGNDLLLYIGDGNNPPTLDSNSLTGTWTGTTPAPTENRFLNGLGGDQPVYGYGDDLRYWNTTRTLAEIQSFSVGRKSITLVH